MIAQVIVDIKAYAVDRIFDYQIPDTLQVDIGMRVRVPFGPRVIDGYIVSISEQASNPEMTLKSIIAVSEIQFLNAELIDLAQEFAQQTASFQTSFLQAMLPKDVTKRKIKTIKVITELIDKPIPHRAHKKKEVLDSMTPLLEPVTVKDLQQQFSPAIVNALIKEGYLVVEEVEAQNIPTKKSRVQPTLVTLREEQKQVLSELAAENNDTFLLQGVTGSGKTEVYLQYVEQILQQGKSAIVLVPEIGLTPQMIERFIQRFGEDVIALLHSKLTQVERFDMWVKIKRQQAQIVLGTRSAIFAPLENIGGIIIDEEHDASYKQENMPTYHARDIALWRARRHQAKLILASATPSLESYLRAQKGVYKLLRLQERIQANNCLLHIVDMREQLTTEETRFFSPVLLQAMKTALTKQEQILLLVNRRGFATVVQCPACSYVPHCEHCDTSLVYHKDTNKFICHYCQYSETATTSCPNCQQQLQYMGVGIQRIVETVETLFPTARILRADRDNIKHLDDYHNLYNQFSNQNADILVGTQMIAKGFDFPNVTVVGVLETDQLLNMPDVRAKEKAYQLLMQMIGRTGRGHKLGNAYIQTYDATHPLFAELQEGDYIAFAERELASRKMFQNPPYWNLSDLIISAENIHDVSQCTTYMYEQLQRLSAYATMYPPAQTFLKRVNNRYHFHILLKYKNSANVIPNVHKLIIYAGKKYPNVRSYLQINPITFM